MFISWAKILNNYSGNNMPKYGLFHSYSLKKPQIVLLHYNVGKRMRTQLAPVVSLTPTQSRRIPSIDTALSFFGIPIKLKTIRLHNHPFKSPSWSIHTTSRKLMLDSRVLKSLIWNHLEAQWWIGITKTKGVNWD